jgi:hypothetical protein
MTDTNISTTNTDSATTNVNSSTSPSHTQVNAVNAVNCVNEVNDKDKVTNQAVHPLNDKWWLWMHGMRDSDWSANSYKRLGEPITTVEQFLGLNRKLTNCIADSMFFLMRHGPGDEENPIYPMWEDRNCENGGAWKFKVTRDDAAQAWKDIAIRLIGETITSCPSDILGVSISPKKTFVTIRVWNKNSNKSTQSQLLIPDSEYFQNAIYDTHKDYKDNPQGV